MTDNAPNTNTDMAPSTNGATNHAPTSGATSTEYLQHVVDTYPATWPVTQMARELLAMRVPVPAHPTPAPDAQLLCMLCERVGVWGAYHTAADVAICMECRLGAYKWTNHKKMETYYRELHMVELKRIAALQKELHTMWDMFGVRNTEQAVQGVRRLKRQVSRMRYTLKQVRRALKTNTSTRETD